jgi:hypothetical protein
VFSQSSKEDSNLAIADKKISAGDSLAVKLTDSNGKAIANQTVNVKLTDKDGTGIDEDITTDSNGNAKFKMKDEGKYSVKCGFDGNGQYASSSTAGNITVKKATTEVVNEEKTSTTTHTSKYASDGSIYPEYGPEVDSQGITREYAIAHNMHYVESTVDGDRPGEMVTVGGYTKPDPNTGYYHN